MLLLILLWWISISLSKNIDDKVLTSLTKLLLEQDGSEEVITHGDLGNFGNVTDYFIFTNIRIAASLASGTFRASAKINN